MTLPEAMAGPAGLLLFLGLIPFVRLLARWNKTAGIVLPAAAWLLLTGGVLPGAVLVGWVAVATGFVVLLLRLRRSGRLGRDAGLALLWIGLGALFLPLWWKADFAWYGWFDLETRPIGWLDFRPSPLHFLGFAYYYLRLLGWGRRELLEPGSPGDWRATLCWLAYAPTMRLGPLIERDAFAEQFRTWDPRGPIAWRRVFYHFGLLVGGGVVAGVLGHNLGIAMRPGDFLSEPEKFSTAALLGLLYGVPIALYLFLWLYNELAAVCGLLIGIPVPGNFNWVPLSTDIVMFWRRWHLTVSGWLRHNIYFPLGGSRRLPLLSLLGTFLFCGWWHGAAVSFLVWGGLQAVGITIQRWWSQRTTRDNQPHHPLWVAFSWLLTMNFATITLAIFLDFEHAGSRVLLELWKRLA